MSLAMDIAEERIALIDAENAQYNKSVAMAQANRIRDYWAERGYKVQVRVINRGFSHQMRGVRYDIESDLICGLPKNFRKLPLRE